MQKFHYAFKVKDIESTLRFYHTILGCKIGRQTEHWVDFDFFGHQLSAHISSNIPELDYCGQVDGVRVPIPHFGCLLTAENFDVLQKNLEHHNISFVIPPQTRYEGQNSEQRTMFVLDFSNNPIEFKCFTNPEAVFD